MAFLLKWGGGLWAFIGLFSLLVRLSEQGAVDPLTGRLSASLQVNFMTGIVLGSALCALGVYLDRRRPPPPPEG